MRTSCLRTLLTCLILLVTPIAQAQVSADDVLFARLQTMTLRMNHEKKNGGLTEIAPLLEQANKLAPTDRVAAYRSYMHAIALFNGIPWNNDVELATALDFALNAKVVDVGEHLNARAMFLFDAPAANNAPYKLRLEILNGDKSPTAVEPHITLADVRSRRRGETIGLSFDPSKLVQPGTYVLRAILVDGSGKAIQEYSRTFVLMQDLKKRITAVDKVIQLLADNRTLAATTARYHIEEIKTAHRVYVGGGFQNLSGYLHSSYRNLMNTRAEAADYEAGLTQAATFANTLAQGKNPIATLRGDMKLAYLSPFDGQLVPFRLYIPTNYDPSKRYPMVTLLHGAGGSENSFFEGYQGSWPKVAQERGYIIVAVNGRGATGGYGKNNGGEQDVLDVTQLVQQQYKIDPTRVYLAGHSMGGAGTWNLGLAHRERFTAIAPMAYTQPSEALFNTLKAGRKIPIVIVCGAQDALFAVAGCRTVVDAAKAQGYPVKYLEYPEADHNSVVTIAVNDVFDWFDSNQSMSTASRSNKKLPKNPR